MYVFLPSTVPALATLLDEGRLEGEPLIAFTADPGPGDDAEEAEYDAMYAAAEESLRLLRTDPGAPRRRVVLTAEMPDHVVDHEARQGDGVARVSVRAAIPYKKLKSAHVDDEGAAADIAEAADDPASEAAGDHELLWFAVQEIRYLIEDARP
ncbi:hypothetical protein [Nocardiopsis sp. MG754419]|uniref:DUF6912 family protein n=1 Tax=Nocardiopsis sp. MG754419 TaxID=2259865 RepID=UPI001BAC228A|nr:hypothetical protein [Nocardiopsis sp. MG754419]MBR8741299.1 hypothetical protein [Nocardiopsis sp. MG754419]